MSKSMKILISLATTAIVVLGAAYGVDWAANSAKFLMGIYAFLGLVYTFYPTEKLCSDDLLKKDSFISMAVKFIRRAAIATQLAVLIAQGWFLPGVITLYVWVVSYSQLKAARELMLTGQVVPEIDELGETRWVRKEECNQS